MYISLSTFDEEGQFDAGCAIEVKSALIYGFTDNGIFVDIYHADGEHERIKVWGSSIPFTPMKIGDFNRIDGIRFVEYPSTPIITKEQFRKKFGIGRLFR